MVAQEGAAHFFLDRRLKILSFHVEIGSVEGKKKKTKP